MHPVYTGARLLPRALRFLHTYLEPAGRAVPSPVPGSAPHELLAGLLVHNQLPLAADAPYSARPPLGDTRRCEVSWIIVSVSLVSAALRVVRLTVLVSSVRVMIGLSADKGAEW